MTLLTAPPLGSESNSLSIMMLPGSWLGPCPSTPIQGIFLLMGLVLCSFYPGNVCSLPSILSPTQPIFVFCINTLPILGIYLIAVFVFLAHFHSLLILSLLNFFLNKNHHLFFPGSLMLALTPSPLCFLWTMLQHTGTKEQTHWHACLFFFLCITLSSEFCLLVKMESAWKTA